ncbi:hypothetical protein BST97_00875 [Nonlabens spongiae]|uniref:Sodium/calcium exchanger membrane region domain-containing protein n=1 Tax=Nonlabens spongiae TaxID=331648 RepID=A0A1W6MGG6_9FLAO|nr:calcium/sodium antiporter [Nonlabens spongiae]ARN76670.1 hypothetical protein BST97_00875 [Nonlabens spongiae]
MGASIGFLLLGFILLVAGGEFLVRASVGLSLKLNLSRLIIGLTVVSFATSAPELLVSVQGAINGSSGIALGNVVGSNIANLGLVLALTAIISSLEIDRDFFKFNWPWMMGFSILLYLLISWDQNLTRLEGLILVGLLVLFVFFLIRKAKKKPPMILPDEEIASQSWGKIIFFMIAGGGLLWGGSELLVDGATTIATYLEIPESVIAVSMVAIGTSVPELAASIIAAVKKEKAISLGNLIGSNIFNIGSVLGITSLIEPIILDESNLGLLENDIFWMLGFAFCLLPLAFISKQYTINSYKGLLMLGAYALFIYLIFQTP